MAALGPPYAGNCVVMAERSSRVLRKGRPTQAFYTQPLPSTGSGSLTSTKRTVLRCNGGPLFQSPSEGPPYAGALYSAVAFDKLRKLCHTYPLHWRGLEVKGQCGVVMAAHSSRVLRKGRPTRALLRKRSRTTQPRPSTSSGSFFEFLRQAQEAISFSSSSEGG
jgi:hypothetical protein